MLRKVNLGNYGEIKTTAEFEAEEGGNLILTDKKITYLEGVTSVKNADFRDSGLVSLGSLKDVEYDLLCNYLESLEDTGEATNIGGEAVFRGTSIKSLNKIKKVGQLDCDHLKCLENLGELEYILRNGYLRGTSTEDLGILGYVGWSLYCKGNENLKTIKTKINIGEDFYAQRTGIIDFSNVSVGRKLYLSPKKGYILPDCIKDSQIKVVHS